MAETAAHLVDRVLPPLPVHQWVLSLPKRLRYRLRHDREAIHSALRIFLDELARHWRAQSPGARTSVMGGRQLRNHRCR